MWVDKTNKAFNPAGVHVVGGQMYNGTILLFPDLVAELGLQEIPDPQPPVDYDPEMYDVVATLDAPYMVWERKPEDQIVEIILRKAKTLRTQEVAELTVTTSVGNTFDANEDAQRRITMAIVALPDDTITTPWVLASNAIVQVNRAELLEALRLAGSAMSEVWIKPYQVAP